MKYLPSSDTERQYLSAQINRSELNGKPLIVKINGHDCIVIPKDGEFDLYPMNAPVNTSGVVEKEIVYLPPKSPQESFTNSVEKNHFDYSNPAFLIAAGLSVMAFFFFLVSIILGNQKPYVEKITDCKPSSWFLIFPVGETCQTIERRYE